MACEGGGYPLVVKALKEGITLDEEDITLDDGEEIVLDEEDVALDDEDVTGSRNEVTVGWGGCYIGRGKMLSWMRRLRRRSHTRRFKWN